MTEASARRSSRLPIAALELFLLAISVALMWWHPLGDSISVVLASALTIIFLSLLPVLFKGGKAAKSESDLVQREFSVKDERDKFRKR